MVSCLQPHGAQAHITTRSRRICGGQARLNPGHLRGSPHRHLNQLAHKLDDMNVIVDQIISAFTGLGLPEAEAGQIDCIAEIIPTVQSVDEIDMDNLPSELQTDNQIVLELIANMNLLQENGNDVNLPAADYQFALENLAYDALCAINKASRALGEHLPRVAQIPIRHDTCNIGDHVYSRLLRDYGLLREMRRVMRDLFTKYHFIERSLRG